MVLADVLQCFLQEMLSPGRQGHRLSKVAARVVGVVYILGLAFSIQEKFVYDAVFAQELARALAETLKVAQSSDALSMQSSFLLLPFFP